MILNKKNTVVSLFSGCGGLDLGFIWSDYNIVWANDILPDACSTYSKNIGPHVLCGDITKIDHEQIPKADIIIGGPPCQGFSGIGKRNPNDQRSSLVWNYLDVLKSVKPKIFLFENVTGIKSSKSPDGSKVVDNLAEAFRELGYDTDIYTLNAADYGVPQRRKRVFIVGNNLGKKITPPPETHSSENLKLKKWVSSYDALSDLGQPTENGISTYIKAPDNEFLQFVRKNQVAISLHTTPYASKKDMELIMHIPPGGNYLDVPDAISTKRIMYFKKTGGRTTTYGRLDPAMPSHTLNTYFNRLNIGCNIHYRDKRIISIREGMRLQSFPDDFTIISSTQRNYYVQVGNAVPPLLGLAWAKHLKQYLE